MAGMGSSGEKVDVLGVSGKKGCFGWGQWGNVVRGRWEGKKEEEWLERVRKAGD